jgi:hypothetical protein
VVSDPSEYNTLIILPDGNNDLINNLSRKFAGICDDVRVSQGDVRIDMPVLIGSLRPAVRILILGLEPRHSDDFYNVA